MEEVSREAVIKALIELIKSQPVGWRIRELSAAVRTKLNWKSTVANTTISTMVETLVVSGWLKKSGRRGDWVSVAESSTYTEPSSGNDQIQALKARINTLLLEREEQNKKLDKATTDLAMLAKGMVGAKNVIAALEKTKKESQQGTREIVLTLPNSAKKSITKQHHRCFEKVLRLCNARKNVLLIGPAGTGKTHLAGQVAEALGLTFSHISCSAGMSEGQLTGRLLPTGDEGKFEYIASPFVNSYENGGLFLFDELDAADSNTMLVLNSALANGSMSVPNRPSNPVAKKNKDFVCIAAANTYGTGADRQYVGRNQMDESTLDRFRIGQVEMDYDEPTERSLCPDGALYARLLGYREKARRCKLRRIVSMRFMADAYLMKQQGFDDNDIDTALFCGWSTDEVAKVKGSF